MIITTHKRNLGKGNIFTVSVILSMGRGVGFPTCITGHMTGGLHLGVFYIHGVSTSMGVCIWLGLHPGGSALGWGEGLGRPPKYMG